MKKSEFKTLIREIVREEVKMELRSYLSEFKTKQIKAKTIKIKPKKIKATRQRYTKNNSLNDILNETAMSDEWKTLGGETFSTSNMSSILDKQYSGNSKQNVNDIPASMGIEKGQVPDHVHDALTKDYSGLMKAIDKKKGR
jgi:DNA-directed RNA polymerase specialized sigma subunit|tara:strand:+ start:2876 stop:3298 length:423 start_codon:yes stop_codon:yes gene_type:complete